MNQGIDYGRGVTNIDLDTKIRYGVIPANDVGGFWFDESKPVYPCENTFDDDDEGGCDWEPQGFEMKADGYEASQTYDDCDIFVLKSPYYTFAAFCSPCAPGACYLRSPMEGTDGIPAYCFGNDCFDEHSPCPYPVYKIADGTCIYKPKETN